MLYLSYGVYRSSFVFDNIFHLIKRHTQNTRKCTRYTRKKVSLEPLSKSNIKQFVTLVCFLIKLSFCLPQTTKKNKPVYTIGAYNEIYVDIYTYL